jgi:hypothetical protein
LKSWTISAAPEIRIGDDADPHTLFARIAAVRTPSGEIVVEDFATAELRVFSRSGSFVRNLSRRGSGPGEYQQRSVLLRAGDTLFVVENPPGARQIHVFTVADGFRTRMPLRATNAPRGVSAIGRLSGGEFLVSAGSGFRVLDPNLSAGVLSRDSMTLGILTVGDPGQVVWLGAFPNVTLITYASPFLSGRAGLIRTLLGPFLAIAVSADRVWIGDSGTGEIAIFDAAGKPVSRVTMPTRPRPLNDPAIERARQRALASATTDDERARVDAQYAKASRPRTAPHFTNFTPGVDGEMWIALFDEDPSAPTRFLVLDRSGKPRARAVLSPNVTATEIGRDYVLGRQTDRDGIESVIRFRLAR